MIPIIMIPFTGYMYENTHVNPHVSESRSVVSDSLQPPFHGILQARILEWLAFPSKVSSQPKDRTQVSHIAGGFFTS